MSTGRPRSGRPPRPPSKHYRWSDLEIAVHAKRNRYGASLQMGELRRGGERVVFYRWPPPKLEGAVRIRDERHGLELLRRWAEDPGTMSVYRRMLCELHLAAPVHRYTDDEVLRALATSLVDGTVRVTTARLKEALKDAYPPDKSAPKPALPSKIKALLDKIAAAKPAGPLAGLGAIAVQANALKEAIAAKVELVEAVKAEIMDVRVEIEQCLVEVFAVAANIQMGQLTLKDIPPSCERVTAAMSNATKVANGVMDAL